MLPYLPYFSNCRGFDSSIPLFALTESSGNCTLVPEVCNACLSMFFFIAADRRIVDFHRRMW